MARGVPAEAEAGTALTRFAAKVVHLGLYLLMLALPITGLAAWFGGITSAADVHELMKPLLILLIALHVIGALWHQFVLKDNLLARMKRPG
jgi:cytochrome b561